MVESIENHGEVNSQVREMFGDIAPRYDFLNRVLSFGRDRYWRKRAVARLAPRSGERFLDIATGTAEVALEIARTSTAGGVQVVGVDFSEAMLKLARKKIQGMEMTGIIRLETGIAEHLPFEDNSFDGTTTAFGVRNFSDVDLGLNEMRRVLKPGGRCVILEFSLPRNPVLNFIYRAYFENLLPRVGCWFSRHPSAYTYLPETVSAFPVRDKFSERMRKAGFVNVSYRELTFGIVILYTGIKKI